MKETHLRKNNHRFPFCFQSAPLVFMGIAAARHAHSVCTAADPATTSRACVTACPASQVLSAMKVRHTGLLEREVLMSKPHAFCPQASQGHVFSYQLFMPRLRCVCSFCKYDFELWKRWLATPALFSERGYSCFNWKQPLMKHQHEEGFWLPEQKVIKSEMWWCLLLVIR